MGSVCARLEEPLYEELLAREMLFFCKLFLVLDSLTEGQVFDIVLCSPEQLRHFFVVDVQLCQLCLVDEQSEQMVNSGGLRQSLTECSFIA